MFQRAIDFYGRQAARARGRRAALFRDMFNLDADTRVLDLGGGPGIHIHSVLQGTLVRPSNVCIADISAEALERGRADFGYVPMLLDESGRLPFEDGSFDVVYCSSVIEHVTVPKREVWDVRSGREFRERAFSHQRAFAREIERVGRQYFVQTPYRWFVLEAHSWLPFLSWLPRRAMLPVLKFARRFWPRRTQPDWYLLNKRELASLFEGAEIRAEKWMGLTKSIMAVKTRATR